MKDHNKVLVVKGGGSSMGVSWYLSHHLKVNACCKTGARATLKTTYTFTKPRTYFQHFE